MNWDGYDTYDNEYILNNLNLESKNMYYPTIDHRISIHEGFIKNIPPYIIGSIKNLCITKRMINLLKRNRVDFMFDEEFKYELSIVRLSYKKRGK